MGKVRCWTLGKPDVQRRGPEQETDEFGSTTRTAYPETDRNRLDGEFDPGSGQTLAACVTHASRTECGFRTVFSGGRGSNTWMTFPGMGDTLQKWRLIPHELVVGDRNQESRKASQEGSAAD